MSPSTEQPVKVQSALLDQLHHWLCRIKPLVQCEALNYVEQARAGRALREAFNTLEELKQAIDDPLKACVQCGTIWPKSELFNHVCPDCGLVNDGILPSLATEHTERAQRPVSGEGHSETSVNSVANSLPEDTHA